MSESRVHKSILNAKVMSLFYFLNLAIAFVSRKVFLQNLGDEFIGLTGTLNGFISFLSLSEMGIGTAIAFNLYRPLQQGEKEKINELISLFGFFFQKVGIFVGLAALSLSFFFPLIFKGTDMPFLLIFVTFYSFVSSSLISYFLNYRQILLAADQKNYVVEAYFQSAFIVKTITQMVLAYLYQNLYVWVLLEFLFSWVACIILNWKINKTYPWLKINLKNGKAYLKKYPQVLKSSKQVFIHSIKSFLINRCDQMLVFAYVSLEMVAHYGNYMLIITKAVGAFNSIMGATGASIGNLVAEGNKKNILKVFWELSSLQLTIGGVLFVSLFFFTPPLIELWLGGKYVMPTTILFLMLLSTYLNKALETISSFNHAYGQYADIWTVWVEGGLFLGVTLCTAPFIGISGILLGRISSLIFDLVWKPYYLFKGGIKESVRLYWKGFMHNFAIFVVCFGVAFMAYDLIDFKITNFLELIFYAAAFNAVFVILFISMSVMWGYGTRNLLLRIPVVRNLSNKIISKQ